MFTATPIPVAAVFLILLTWLGCYRFWWARLDSKTESFLLACLVTGLLSWLLSELQSLLHILTPTGAAVTWTLTTALAWSLALAVPARASATPGLQSASKQPPVGLANWWLIGGILSILATTGLVAWICPVMAWDALSYHVPRFLYWIQYGSIEHFPTPNARLLFMAPWPAFVQMQIYLLAGSDRLANILQWLSLGGCVVAAAATARALGAQLRSQIVAGALVASIPMAVQQATTAQTDLTVSFWLIVFAYFSLSPFWKKDHGWRDRLAAGVALGLATLSKGTTIPIAAPFLIAFAVGEVRRFKTAVWKPLVVVCVVALSVNVPHFARNTATFGEPLAPEGHHDLVRNQSLRPQYLVSNILRHTLVHLGTWNNDHAKPLMAVSDFVHGLLGVEDGDPLNSHKGQELRITSMRRNESLAGNGLHLLLIAVCGVWFISHRRRLWSASIWAYTASLAASFILFCLAFKYQHTISRLQLPLFVLGAPWAAAVLDRWVSPRTILIVGWLFVVGALPWIVLSEPRPLLGEESIFRQSREELLYSRDRTYSFPAVRIARRAQDENQDTVGFVSNGECLEYYLWYELRKYNVKMPRIENLAPDDGSTPQLAVRTSLASPPGLVGWFKEPKPPRLLTLSGVEYSRMTNWRWAPFAVFKPARKPPGGVEAEGHKGS